MTRPIVRTSEADQPPTPLFRPEAMAERQSQWLGTVLLTPPPSHVLFTVLGVLAAMAVVGLLFTAEFTRKARISGWLVPEKGLVRIFPPRPGIVTALYVTEGASIRKGEPLVTISGELQSATLGATQAEVVRRLDERRRSLQDERTQQERLLGQQHEALTGRLQALRSELRQIEQEVALLKEREAIATRGEARNRELHAQGLISEDNLQRAEAERLEQRLRLRALERMRTTIVRERVAIEGELRDQPLKMQSEIGNIDRQISQVEQERAETEARREVVVPAPHDGTVTALQAVVGQNFDSTVPLLAVMPTDAHLEAHLYSPSRTVGFVRTGQRVLLRYEPYPYQRFGHYEGSVAAVSWSAVTPADLPSQLASVTTLTGSASATEPLYRITVRLASQTVSAYGRPVLLQPGMMLEADITLEKRRLYQWVLDPLFTLTGKVQ